MTFLSRTTRGPSSTWGRGSRPYKVRQPVSCRPGEVGESDLLRGRPVTERVGVKGVREALTALYPYSHSGDGPVSH